MSVVDLPHPGPPLLKRVPTPKTGEGAETPVARAGNTPQTIIIPLPLRRAGLFHSPFLSSCKDLVIK